MRRKLTYEFCEKETKKYKYYTEIRDNDLSLYNKCKQNGWIKKFKWLEDNILKYDLSSKIHLIYAYIFEKNKTIYVGRTFQLTQRHYSHQHPKNGKHDSVLDYCIKNHLEFPKPIILEHGLTLEESQEKEKWWCEFYKKNNYNLINIAKTGKKSSSIGRIGIKWTKSKVIEEAKKYFTIGEFRKNCFQAYKVSLKRKWIDDFYWLKKIKKERNYWTYEKCYETAKKYKTINEYRKNDNSSYVKASKEKWTRNFVWLYKNGKQRTKWNKELCEAESKKYKSKWDFQKNNHPCYDYARRNGFLKDFIWLNKKMG